MGRDPRERNLSGCSALRSHDVLRRAGSPSARRGAARAAVRAARSASDRLGRRLRRLGPNARAVSVVGDFNDWLEGREPLEQQGSSGIWAGVVAEAEEGHAYKYSIRTRDGELRLKADPVAFRTEVPPKTASLVFSLAPRVGGPRTGSSGGDPDAARRADLDLRGPPRLVAAQPGRGRQPPAHVPRAGRRARRLRARHGLHAHRADAGDGAPVRGLLGLPGDGLLRPDARASAPRRLPRVRRPPALARARRDPRLGPAHFPRDDFALARFDGTALYEHADPRRGAHPTGAR
jgi:1,4-alpha-glucan branching enzyme